MTASKRTATLSKLISKIWQYPGNQPDKYFDAKMRNTFEKYETNPKSNLSKSLWIWSKSVPTWTAFSSYLAKSAKTLETCPTSASSRLSTWSPASSSSCSDSSSSWPSSSTGRWRRSCKRWPTLTSGASSFFSRVQILYILSFHSFPFYVVFIFCQSPSDSDFLAQAFSPWWQLQYSASVLWRFSSSTKLAFLRFIILDLWKVRMFLCAQEWALASGGRNVAVAENIFILGLPCPPPPPSPGCVTAVFYKYKYKYKCKYKYRCIGGALSCSHACLLPYFDIWLWIQHCWQVSLVFQKNWEVSCFWRLIDNASGNWTYAGRRPTPKVFWILSFPLWRIFKYFLAN